MKRQNRQIIHEKKADMISYYNIIDMTVRGARHASLLKI